MSSYILAIDQGTSSSRALIFDQSGKIISSAQQEFTQFFPKPGWVEHDAEEIWTSVSSVIEKAVNISGITANDIKGIGITNQRETTVIWEKNTGKTVHKAIVWQSRQTELICDNLKENGFEELFRKKTGLVIDSYFSGPKIRYILDETNLQAEAEKGNILFGTIDSWLLWKLTGEKSHRTDFTNASRTLLFNIHSLEWDDELCQVLNIPQAMLPEVKKSSSHFGTANCPALNNEPIPISGIAGDQQAALFGQQCIAKGQIKNTYGTGCFMLMNTGAEPVISEHGLLTTVACSEDGSPCYALEGSVFVAGSAVQWLRDSLQIINKAPDSEELAGQLEHNDGVYIVPAFAGLGSPYWKSEVRGAIFGLTRGADRRHFARATLESIAYQVKDIVKAMCADSSIDVTELRVDGGAVSNSFLMQFQSDLLNCRILIPENNECTVTGAALLAGLGCGLWSI
jgi:glycerol kinase